MELPSFYCPITPAVHPRLDRIEQRAAGWMKTTGLYRDDRATDRGLATRSAELACRILPSGPEDTVWLLSAWNYWSFALGDREDTAAEAKDVPATDVAGFTLRALRALAEPGYCPRDAAACERTLAELVEKTRCATTPVQFARLADGLRDWLLALSWRSAARGATPGVDDFAAMLPAARGTRFFAAWLETGGAEIPVRARWTPAVRAVTGAAGLIVSCDNDIVGYATDRARAARNQNILTVLMARRHYSLAEAITETVRLRDRAMKRFLALRNRLSASASPGLRRYLGGLGHYVRGCLDWMNTAPRYTGPHRDDGAGARPAGAAKLNLTITSLPPETPDSAPGLAPIDWWWDV